MSLDSDQGQQGFVNPTHWQAARPRERAQAQHQQPQQLLPQPLQLPSQEEFDDVSAWLPRPEGEPPALVLGAWHPIRGTWVKQAKRGRGRPKANFVFLDWYGSSEHLAGSAGKWVSLDSDQGQCAFVNPTEFQV